MRRILLKEWRYLSQEPTRFDQPIDVIAVKLSVKQGELTVRKVPSTHIIIERKMINRRPNVAPLLPVACEYTTASGKEPLLVTTASWSFMPYIIAIA